MPLARSISLRFSSSLRASSSSRVSRRKGVEPADRHIEDRLDALLLQPVDDIGRDPSLDCGLDRGEIGAVDEHRDRTLNRPGELEHVFQHVAVRVLQIDHDHVRIDLGDVAGDAIHVVDDGDILMAGLPQARLDDRGADPVLVDD